jgi:hypothetical protein
VGNILKCLKNVYGNNTVKQKHLLSGGKNVAVITLRNMNHWDVTQIINPTIEMSSTGLQCLLSTLSWQILLRKPTSLQK